MIRLRTTIAGLVIAAAFVVSLNVLAAHVAPEPRGLHCYANPAYGAPQVSPYTGRTQYCRLEVIQ